VYLRRLHPQHVEIELRDAAGRVLDTRRLHVSLAELQLSLRFWPAPRPSIPGVILGPFGFRPFVPHTGDLAEMSEQRMQQIRHDHRHQWTVIGGAGAVDRGAGFTGFLEEILRNSGF
jgi:hypothetical protein